MILVFHFIFGGLPFSLRVEFRFNSSAVFINIINILFTDEETAIEIIKAG